VPLLSLYAVYLASDDEILRSRLSDFVSRWRYVAPQTTGLDLRARGLPAGPRYRQILDRLRAAWLDGEVATPEQERELLDKLGG
jgi:tRNA nucleotidyltransferase (CCA-adding enzyme)